MSPWSLNGVSMFCPKCASGNGVEFATEMMIHFQGLKHLDDPAVWLFPKILDCLDCGSSLFSVPKEELALLASGAQKGERSAA
jgi:hypothetical protein